MTIALVLTILIGLGLYFYISIYNDLQIIKSKIELSENSIDNLLRHKYDMICDINIEIKEKCKDKDYLKEYIELKDKKLTNYETDRKLSECINLIKELISDNKKLDNDKTKKFIKEIKKIDDKLLASKNFFNKHTATLNEIVRVFPKNIVAKNHKFKVKPFFDNKNMQDAVIDDFKL